MKPSCITIYWLYFIKPIKKGKATLYFYLFLIPTMLWLWQCCHCSREGNRVCDDILNGTARQAHSVGPTPILPHGDAATLTNGLHIWIMPSDSFGKGNRNVPASRGSAQVQTQIGIGVGLMSVFGFLWIASKARRKEGHKIGRRCWKSPYFAICLKSGYSKLNSCYRALIHISDRGKASDHCPLTLMPASTAIQFP